MAETGGDPIELARKLGIDEDQLKKDSLLIIEFQPTRSYNAHMPSGNEFGANKHWLPGGRLPEGDVEAVVRTEGMLKGQDYVVRDIKTGELL
jgi:hypothetical protein